MYIRFFADHNTLKALDGGGTYFSFTGDGASHMFRSLRMRKGDELLISMGKDPEYLFEIAERRGETAVLLFKKSIYFRREPELHIKLWQCMPKKDKFEKIIEKSVELGVFEITPLISSRCIGRDSSENSARKTERRNKISRAAAEQSGRGIIPIVTAQLPFEEGVRRISEDIRKGSAIAFMPWEEESGLLIGKYISSLNLKENALPKNLHFIIGPEGGISMDEADMARKHGIASVSLGRHILRTETAGPAVLAMLNVLLPGRMRIPSPVFSDEKPAAVV